MKIMLGEGTVGRERQKSNLSILNWHMKIILLYTGDIVSYVDGGSKLPRNIGDFYKIT
jgi:hypothetical protein